MKSVGRAIQRATWTTDGAVGPGGNPLGMLLTLRHQSPVSSAFQGWAPTDLAMFISMQGGPLDHVALWTDERHALADFLCERAGMHVIDKTDTFTLVGADAKKGKLTLFDADGPREPGALGHVGLNVHDESLAGNVSAPGGLELQFVDHREGDEWDLNHVRLKVPDPA